MKKEKYLFKSDRLGFRNWSNKDVAEFAKLNADEEVMEHFPKTLSKKEVEELIQKLRHHFAKNGFTYYAIEILATKEFIGMLGLAFQEYQTEFTPAIDIGWRLKRSAWGKGYATEGAKRCLKYAFDELGIDKIISVCTIHNQQSENVMKKIGMTKIGAFNHPEMINHPEYEKHFCYEIRKKTNEMIKLERTNSKHKDFEKLVEKLDQELAERDGEDHAFYSQFNKIDMIKHVVLVYENNEAIGCGAIKEYNETTMEVKRMYTEKTNRGKGIATLVLKELERWARELGYKKCILETGLKQPEAIRLYEKNGYQLIPNYGQYAEVEDSRCFEKQV